MINIFLIIPLQPIVLPRVDVPGGFIDHEAMKERIEQGRIEGNAEIQADIDARPFPLDSKKR